MTKLRSLGNGLHPVGDLTVANYALNPSMEATAAASLSATVRTNLCTHPNFTNDTAGWTPSGGCSVFNASPQLISGAGLQISWIAGAGQKVTSPSFTTVVGHTYTVSVWAIVRNSQFNVDYDFAISIDGGTTVADTTVGKGTNKWVRLKYTFTATATSHALTVIPAVTPTGSVASHLDAVLFEESAFAGPYFDGDGALLYEPYVECAWTGAQWGSTSTATFLTQRTNQILNPSFEVDTSNWSPANAGTITRVFGGGLLKPLFGNCTAKVTGTATSDGAQSNNIPMVQGQSLSVTTWYQIAVASVTSPVNVLSVWFFTSGNALISTVNSSFSGSAAMANPARARMVAVAPATTAYARVVLGTGTTGTAARTTYYDAILAELGPSNPRIFNTNLWECRRSYFDGSVDQSVSRVNEVFDPSNEAQSGNWYTGGATPPTLTLADTTHHLFGPGSMRVAWAASVLNNDARANIDLSTQATFYYTFSCYVYVPSGNSPVNLIVREGASLATIPITGFTTSTVYDDWQRLYITFQAPTDYCTVSVVESQNNTGTMYVDAVMFEPSPSLGDYFDATTGTLGGTVICERGDLSSNNFAEQRIPNGSVAWSGTAHASTSIRSFYGLANWTPTNANLIRSSNRSLDGYYSAQISPTNIGLNPQMSQTFSVIDSTNYSVTFYVAIPTTLSGGGISVLFAFYDASNVLITQTPVPLLLSGSPIGWTRLATTIMTPAGTNTMTVSIQELNAPTNLGDVWYVDAFMLEQADQPFPYYIDGDFSGCCWSGTREISTSLRTDFPDRLNFFGTYIWQNFNNPGSTLPMGGHATLHEAPWSPVPLTD